MLGQAVKRKQPCVFCILGVVFLTWDLRDSWFRVLDSEFRI